MSVQRNHSENGKAPPQFAAIGKLRPQLAVTFSDGEQIAHAPHLGFRAQRMCGENEPGNDAKTLEQNEPVVG